MHNPFITHILQQLEHTPKSKALFQAKCPCHDDYDQSLRIDYKNGQITLTCPVGCQTDDLCRRLGLTPNDLPGKDPEYPHNRLISFHDYRDEFDTLLYRVLKYESDTIKHYRPDGHCGFIYNLDGVRRVPYKLPNLIKQPLDQWCFIVETEREVDRLITMKLSATCNPGGPGHWHYSYNPYFMNRKVAILPRPHEPGRHHAQELSRQLSTFARKLRIINLNRIPEGGDVCDWIMNFKHGGAKETLLKKAKISLEDAPALETPINLINLDNVSSEPLQWLWPQRFPTGKISLIVGDTGLGKSFLTLNLAAHVSTGKKFPDEPDEQEQREPANVILLTNEDETHDTIRPRLDAMHANCLRITLIQSVKKSDNHRLFNFAKDMNILQNVVQNTQDVKLVIIDPLDAYLSPHMINHPQSLLDKFITPLKLLAATYQLAVICTTHYRCDHSHTLYRAIRNTWLLTKDHQTPQRRLLLPLKSNFSPQNNNALAFQINNNIIQWDPDQLNIIASDFIQNQQNKRHSTRTNEIKNWLLEILSDGPQWSKDIKIMAREEGFAWSTLNIARRAAGIISERYEYQGETFWRTPQQEDQKPKKGYIPPEYWTNELIR
ncbi:MAG: AAA family ATPase [Sedimentisphaerales bacterium]|nr:AAA family ATPase [Sedimentisphaerales bacterium]